jgi:hypothetical protein
MGRIRRRTTRGISAATLIFGLFGSLAVYAVAEAPAAHATTSTPLTALINGDSVTTFDGITEGGTPISLEQYAAEKAGYAVTVVSGSTWDSMTAAQFAQYQVLIVGDPICGVTPTSATSNASTWVPVVMGTSGVNSLVGNRVVVGTDPEYHYLYGGGGAAPTNPSDPSTAGAEHLVQDGITYAGGVSGATGIYFDTSCEDNGSDASVLNSLSSTGTGFTENNLPPCGGSVQLIASVATFSTLTDTDIQGWQCSDHITFPTYPTDWQPLAVATDTSTTPTCGTDPITLTTACGQSYVLLAGLGIVVKAPDLQLTPTSATNPAGTDHTVTATVTQSGTPLSGALVSFTVTGQNAGVSGTCNPTSCMTDSSGNVTFTYHDINGPGTDTINASVTVGGITEHATATKTWVASPAQLTLAPPSQSQTVGSSATVTATLTQSGSPLGGGTILFSVSGVNTGSGSGTTAGNGQAPFSYTGTNTGTDTVTACYDANNNGVCDTSEATATATVSWTHPTALAPVVEDSSNLVGFNSVTDTYGLTASANDLVVAYVAADGPKSGSQSITVSGSGLTWSRVAQENGALGDSEVWVAKVTTNKIVKPTAKVAKKGYTVVLTDVSYKNATGIGATGTFKSASGAPTGTVTTTQGNSWVWSVGSDWLKSKARTPGPGQTILSQNTDIYGDTYWVQSTTAATPTAGTSVTINDTAPTADPYNLVLVEIL